MNDTHGEIIKNVSTGLKRIIYSKDGNIYGIDKTSFYLINKETLAINALNTNFNDINFLTLVEDPITSTIYFVDSNNLWSYK